jgi:hypothetical protein
MHTLSRRGALRLSLTAAAALAAARASLASPALTGATAVTNADELLDALRDGQPVVALKPGNFGSVDLSRLPGEARIVSEKPGGAVFDAMTISRTNGLDIEDIALIPPAPLGSVKGATIFRAEPSAERIRLIRPLVRGAPYAESCAGWSVAEWKSRKAIGVWLRGARSALIGGDFYAIGYHALMIEGEDGLVQGNTFQWIAGDVMRALGDRTQVRNNRMRNRVRPINPGEEKQDTHADFFQSWAKKDRKTGTLTPVTGLLFEGNLGLEWDGPDHPLAGYMQGVGLFDGPFINTVIRRNEIWTTAPHGITISDSTGSLVEDNIVGHLHQSTKKKVPWIRLDGATGGTIRGNIVPQALINRQNVATTPMAYGRVRRSSFDSWPMG